MRGSERPLEGPSSSFQMFHSRFAHFLDQFQTLPYNLLIFRTLVQPDSHATAHGWVHGTEQAKSRQTFHFQKRCDSKSLPNVENYQKNERTVRFQVVQCQECRSITFCVDTMIHPGPMMDIRTLKVPSIRLFQYLLVGIIPRSIL